MKITRCKSCLEEVTLNTQAYRGSYREYVHTDFKYPATFARMDYCSRPLKVFFASESKKERTI